MGGNNKRYLNSSISEIAMDDGLIRRVTYEKEKTSHPQ